MKTSPHLTVRTDEDAVTRLVDWRDTVWADIESCDELCRLTLYNDLIPDVYCEEQYRARFSSRFVCNSASEARNCADALASLIHSGYKKDWNWLMSMDMGDLADFFGNKKLRYVHTECAIVNALPTIDKIKKQIPKKQSVFVYVRAPRENHLSLCEMLWEGLSYYLIQYAWEDSLENSAVIDVWYRDE